MFPSCTARQKMCARSEHILSIKGRSRLIQRPQKADISEEALPRPHTMSLVLSSLSWVPAHRQMAQTHHRCSNTRFCRSAHLSPLAFSLNAQRQHLHRSEVGLQLSERPAHFSGLSSSGRGTHTQVDNTLAICLSLFQQHQIVHLHQCRWPHSPDDGSNAS